MNKEYLYNSLQTYFNTLKRTGYKNYTSTQTLLFVLLFKELLESDFKPFIKDEDIKIWKSFLNCLCGTDCVFPYPNICTT